MSTNRYRTQFPQKHTVLPVVHVTSLEQALRNVGIAQQAGADGVFLIGHDLWWTALSAIHVEVKEAFPDFWVGVNFLDLTPEQALRVGSGRKLHSDELRIPTQGIWTDNYSHAPRPDNFNGLSFGGVAFKYQIQPTNLVLNSQDAKQYMDVVVTSGTGTGKAPNVEKIKTMKEAIGDFPLAIASGITTKNVVDFLPYADCFMVATGISSSDDELDPGLTDLLVRMVRAYQP